METKEIEKKINEFKDELIDLKNKLDIDTKEKDVSSFEVQISSSDFWNRTDTKEILEKLKHLKAVVNKYNDIKNSIELLSDMLSLELNSSMIEEIESELLSLQKDMDELKLSTYLNGEYDENNAYIEIHSGAGGTESNDWANMILRMYERYFEKNNYKYEIISKSEGEEVGIKGAILLVKGYYPYGYLKGETGVHRLVRISPFDSNKRRHTSFASVLVTPEIDKNINIEIKDSDVKIDVYHSSGAGGQSVNTTDSAVRITHLPTGIVTSCQVERSQVQNKERAFEMLKSKLFIMQLKEFNKKVNELKGEVMDVNFGSAIRSYVMCPYTLVKDTRTNYETPNVDKVLSGDIQEFLDAYLKL